MSKKTFRFFTQTERGNAICNIWKNDYGDSVRCLCLLLKEIEPILEDSKKIGEELNSDQIRVIKLGGDKYRGMTALEFTVQIDIVSQRKEWIHVEYLENES